MVQVAPVRLTYNPKVLWFDPNGVSFKRGDALIVKTERGTEYGIADSDVRDVTDEDIENLKCALKPVVRKATAEDTVTWEHMQQLAQEALPVFREMVIEQDLDMHPVTVEFLFDGDKAVFYFEAEDRIDFRELVRMLAARFHVRIDMRQIGVRDEARIVGGLGHCGQELCCKRLGGEFNPVTIRMAKDQDLSLNPQKISGVCGRLMCCLRYEADTYKECKSRCPKMNSMVETPAGDAKVVEINVPREMITLMTSEEKRVKVPLEDMILTKKPGKPYKVPRDVYEECVNDSMATTPTVESLVTPLFTGSDKLASTSSTRRSGAHDAQAEQDDVVEDTRRPRRRRGSRGKGQAAQVAESRNAQKAQRNAQSSSAQTKSSSKPKSASQPKTADAQKSASQKKSNNARKQANNQKRSSRPQAPQHTSAPRSNEERPQKRTDNRQPQRKNDAAKRPGQRSSGLSQVSSNQQAPNRSQNGSASAQDTHRKSRRRSHKAQGADSSQQ